MNMQNFKIITLLFILVSNLLVNVAKADDTMLTEKPYFTLRIETKNTLYLAKVNGVVVFDDNSNGNMLIAEKPVNYYMQTGLNTISFELFPKREDEFDSANITLSLYVNKDEAPESEKKLISSINFNGKYYKKGNAIKLSMPEVKLDSKNNFKKSNDGDVIVDKAKLKPGVIMPGTIIISQSFSLATPFPKWGFLDGESIDFPLSYSEYTEQMDLWDGKVVNHLYEEYNKIYKLLSERDLDKVMNLFKERNEEYDIAMYYSKGTYDKKLRKALSSDLDKYTLKLRSIDQAIPYISDDKKLLKLGNVGMIYFVNDEETSFTNYEILFYKKDGKWVISR